MSRKRSSTGGALHKGHFDLRSGKIDLDDVASITRHLHDILTRLSLNRLGYAGTYYPTVTEVRTPSRLHWVTPTTPTSRLGYR
jgi:hypothetical protein